MPPEDYELKPFPTQGAFEKWLARNHDKKPGIRIQVAKKHTGIPSITWDEALEVALCYGWIDGKGKRIDDSYHWQSFAPRRNRSTWSKRNTQIATALIQAGRMKPAGLAEIDRAKADGRWDAAYDSPANAEVPPDLARALRSKPKAKKFFGSLDSRNRYAILHRIQTAKKPETRARRIERFVGMCEAGEKVYP